MGMFGRMAWALILPLLPAILLGLLFTADQFSFVKTDLGQKIGATGPTALYFVLVSLFVSFTRANKLDRQSPIRARLAGEWDAKIDGQSIGKCKIEIDKLEQRLRITGHWVGSDGRPDYWGSGPILLSGDKLSFITQPNDSSSPKVYVDVPLDQVDFAKGEFHGQMHYIPAGSGKDLDANKTAAIRHIFTIQGTFIVASAAIVLISMPILILYLRE